MKKDATLIMKEVKAGGTFRALQEAKKWTDRKQTAVLFCQNSKDLKKQEKQAAIKAGIPEQDIIDVTDLKNWKTKNFLNENNWRGKLFICNKNQTYYQQLMALAPSIEGNALRIIDEYDVENPCHTDGLEENKERIRKGKSTMYSQIDQGLLNIIGEHNEDNLWLVSATHSAAAIANWSFKVIQLDPWHANYKGMTDHKVVEVANTTMDTLLENAELTGPIRDYTLKGTPEHKVLINTTKRVNSEAETVTHARIVNACRELGKIAIEVNGNNPYNQEEWDKAEVVVGGTIFDRTFEAKDVYTQITAYSSTAWYGSVEQQERLCGVKEDPYHLTTLILSEYDTEIRAEVIRVKKLITPELMEMTWEERKNKLPEFQLKPFPSNKNNGGKLTRKNTDNYEPLFNLEVLSNGQPDLSNIRRQQITILSEFRVDDGKMDGTGLSNRDIQGYGNKCSLDTATIKRAAGEVKLRLAANKKNDMGLSEGTRIAGFNKFILGTIEERLKRKEELPKGWFIDAQFDEKDQWYTVYTKKNTTGTRQYIKRENDTWRKT